MSALFQSWLGSNFERFVAVKRAGGVDYTTQVRHLAAFDFYLVKHAHHAPLRRDVLLAFVLTLDRLSPRGRDNVVSTVWQALRFALRHDAPIDRLPARPAKAPSYSRLRPPRIVTLQDVRTVLAEARKLSSRRRIDAHRPAMYATLLGLLFSTGIRISEALALDVCDVDIDGALITIRSGKFGKSRVLPLQSCTLSALLRFIEDPHRPATTAATTPLFVSARRRRLSQFTVGPTFKALCARAGLSDPLPRLHDLRHSFTVLSVLGWYRDNRDINAMLPVLSTYLGHVSVQNTRSYLRQNGLLLEQACRLFAIKTNKLDEVLS